METMYRSMIPVCSSCRKSVYIDEILECSHCKCKICIDCYEDAVSIISSNKHPELVKALDITEGDVICMTCIENQEISIVESTSYEDLPTLINMQFYTEKAMDRYRNRLSGV